MKGQNICKEGEKICLEHPQAKVAVLVVPFPAQGHLNQLLHLANLITSYGLPVHYAGSSSHNQQAKLRLQGWDSDVLSKIHFHDFNLPPYSSPPPNPDTSALFPTHLLPLFNASQHLRQPVSQLLQQLSSKFRRVIVIHDCVAASVVQDIKTIPNAEPYALVPISAFTSFFNSWEKMQQKPFTLDLDVPKGILETDGSLTPRTSSFLVHQQEFWGFESGRLYNTSRAMEGKYVELLQKLPRKAEMKHFVIGPLNPVQIKRKKDNDKHMCLKWLDKQGTGSVIYISFGSSTTMTDEQNTELALGLERSGQKFIWVLRKADTGDIFTGGEVGEPQLPDRYEERVKNRGIVVRDWAPQLEILAHPSTGGFMSHCGWNSCLESISMGVAMAAWPMRSDQPRNAVLVTEVLRVGILVRDWAHYAHVVESTNVENAVRILMSSEEGKKMQKRAAELGDVVRASVAKEGASHLEMDSFISHITR